MKRIAVIFFTLLYFISITGLTISNFYCCGKFKESYIFTPEDITKGCKGSKLPGCCDTKTFLVKVKDDHSPSQQFKVSLSDFSTHIFAVVQIIEQSLSPATESSLFALIHAPPLISKQPVYLTVCNFRI